MDRDKEYGKHLLKKLYEEAKDNPDALLFFNTKKRNVGYKTAQLQVEIMRKLLTPSRWWRFKYWLRRLPDRIVPFFRK